MLNGMPIFETLIFFWEIPERERKTPIRHIRLMALFLPNDWFVRLDPWNSSYGDLPSSGIPCEVFDLFCLHLFSPFKCAFSDRTKKSGTSLSQSFVISGFLVFARHLSFLWGLLGYFLKRKIKIETSSIIAKQYGSNIVYIGDILINIGNKILINWYDT